MLKVTVYNKYKKSFPIAVLTLLYNALSINKYKSMVCLHVNKKDRA